MKKKKIKIPKWYMGLSIETMEKIEGIVTELIKMFPSKKKEKGTGNIKFYI